MNVPKKDINNLSWKDYQEVGESFFKTKEEAVAKVSPLKWISCSHILFIPIYGDIVTPSPEIRIKDALCLM